MYERTINPTLKLVVLPGLLHRLKLELKIEMFLGVCYVEIAGSLSKATSTEL